MKVPGSDGSIKPPARSQDNRVGDAVVQRQVTPEKSGAVTAGLAGELAKPQVDTMKFSSLASLLGQELDPARMVEERRSKIDSIKERVNNKTYARSSEELAASFSEEITLEIMFAGDATREEDSQ